MRRVRDALQEIIGIQNQLLPAEIDLLMEYINKQNARGIRDIASNVIGRQYRQKREKERPK